MTAAGRPDSRATRPLLAHLAGSLLANKQSPAACVRQSVRALFVSLLVSPADLRASSSWLGTAAAGNKCRANEEAQRGA